MEITLTLKIPELNAVLAGLTHLPFKDARPVITIIETQARTQVEANKPKWQPKPPVTKKKEEKKK